jgi:hypothetical protein
VSFRTKGGLDPSVTADWSAVTTLPKSAPSDDDREPSPLPTAAGDLELFWSSTRGGGWSVVRAELDVAAGTWSAAQRIGAGPATQRGPSAAADGAGVLLVFLSNASLPNGGAGGTARTLDVRYAGTTTVRAADAAKRALMGSFDDFQSYTYTQGHGWAVHRPGPGSNPRRGSGSADPAGRGAGRVHADHGAVRAGYSMRIAVAAGRPRKDGS